ncbi:hypothetical protein KJ632_02975, partial [Patescibacteria group bacterium]|nr:hypothetical protein [Patescibacteria group bacterium]
MFCRYVIFGLMVAGFCLGVLWWQMPNDKLQVSFLNVGQGDSIFIKTPENHQILIDGGPENTVLEQLDLVMPYT